MHVCVTRARWVPLLRLEYIHFIFIISPFKRQDDIIKCKHFPRYWPFVRGIHRSPANSHHKGQLRGALLFSLICARINCWVNNRKAGDLRRHHNHYDVTVIDLIPWTKCFKSSHTILPPIYFRLRGMIALYINRLCYPLGASDAIWRQISESTPDRYHFRTHKTTCIFVNYLSDGTKQLPVLILTDHQ